MKSLLVFVAAALAIGVTVLVACTPKAVDCRVEWAKMLDSGTDG